jgi:hypothetical protein
VVSVAIEARVRQLDFEIAGVILRVEAEGEAQTLIDQLSPPLTVSPAIADRPPDWTLRIVDRDEPSLAPRGTWYMTDGLADDAESWAALTTWDAERVELLYHDLVEGITCEVRSERRARRTTVSGPLTRRNRRPLRMVKLFFGQRLQERGWVALHGASFSLDGRGVLACGESGSGKSTLSYMASVDRRGVFFSDDLTLVGSSGSDALIGWPGRIGIPQSVVAAVQPHLLSDLQALRRPPLEVPPELALAADDREAQRRVGRGRRFAFERSEHRSRLGISHGAGAPARLLVFIEAHSAWVGPPRLELAADQERGSLLERHLATVPQRRFLLDVLGIYGNPRSPRPSVPDSLLAVPAVHLHWGVRPESQQSAVPLLCEMLDEIERHDRHGVMP